MLSGYRYRGGKPDDITLIASLVSTPEKAKERKSMDTSSEEGSGDLGETINHGDSPSLFQKLMGIKQWLTMQSRL